MDVKSSILRIHAIGVLKKTPKQIHDTLTLNHDHPAAFEPIYIRVQS